MPPLAVNLCNLLWVSVMRGTSLCKSLVLTFPPIPLPVYIWQVFFVNHAFSFGPCPCLYILPTDFLFQLNCMARQALLKSRTTDLFMFYQLYHNHTVFFQLAPQILKHSRFNLQGIKCRSNKSKHKPKKKRKGKKKTFQKCLYERYQKLSIDTRVLNNTN